MRRLAGKAKVLLFPACAGGPRDAMVPQRFAGRPDAQLRHALLHLQDQGPRPVRPVSERWGEVGALLHLQDRGPRPVWPVSERWGEVGALLHLQDQGPRPVRPVSERWGEVGALPCPSFSFPHPSYARYARFFDTVPPGTRTIHSDAWRDVGISWEPEAAQQGPGGTLPGGLLTWADEEFCGQKVRKGTARALVSSIRSHHCHRRSRARRTLPSGPRTT